MEVKAIRTDADYRDTLREVSALMERNPERESPDGDRLDVLGTLLQAYEAKHYPIAPPDPIDAIKFHMDQSGMGVKDLVPYIGPLNRVYEVLARKRPLTLHMIRRLLTLGIPASSLVGQPEPVAA